MRRIKFRGESAIGTVYGFYVEREGRPYIVNDAGTFVSVEKESVSQLVGCLSNGKEVYESDMLLRLPNSYIFRAKLGDDLTNATEKAGEINGV